ESIAAAALASGTRVLSRSLKYHRPRTFFCFEGHCSGCLVRLDGVPNLRACQSPCTDAAVVEGQNAFPSAEVDLLGAVDFLFARGMDHHTLMTGSSVLNKLANKVVRQLSGLGKLPASATSEWPDAIARDVDACVIGGGPAGLSAAIAIARAGKSTLLVDDQLRPGGSLRADPRAGRERAEQLARDAVAAGVEVFARSTAIGARGGSWVSALDTARGRIECDLVAVAALPSPASEGPRQHGCKVELDPDAGGFRVLVDARGATTAANVWACGDVTGFRGDAA